LATAIMKFLRKYFLSALILVLAIAGAWLLLKPDNKKTSSDKSVATSSISQPATAQLIIGSPNAPKTIVEYGDFQCPICERFFTMTEPALQSEYIKPGEAKIEFRIETHIGAESVTAGEAAYCANDQKMFEAYHNELYKRQGAENSGVFSRGNLKQIATQIGLNQKQFDSCLDSGKYNSLVVKSNNDAHTQAGVSSTPTFFIGERKIVGAQPIAIFRAILDE